jgi:hypothetical protein
MMGLLLLAAAVSGNHQRPHDAAMLGAGGWQDLKGLQAAAGVGMTLSSVSSVLPVQAAAVGQYQRQLRRPHHQLRRCCLHAAQALLHVAAPVCVRWW